MIQTHHTPCCPGRETKLYTAQDRNHRVSSERFDYLHCERCGLVRLANPPVNLAHYYSNDYYDLPSPKEVAAIGARDSFKIELVRRFSTPGRLLEIGPAVGTFALQAKLAGYQVCTIEMDARCCAYLTDRLGIEAIQSDAPHEVIPSLGTHDVIALWHVIEHLPNPWALLESAARSLKPGGILVVATPNPQAWQFGVMGSAWPHVDAPRHLYMLPASVINEYTTPLGLNRVHFDTADSDTQRWNRFGWQRLIMNTVSGKWPRRAGFVAGWMLSIAMAPLDRREGVGSAYTLVLRKSS
jgi:2-polyprenyl-3-methyl-5-hydroxy-6-metoxy-1,4-benzoquinol methylase